MELKSFSVEDTMALAASFAAYLKPSDCILLAGDLGAGKTHFVKGLGRGLGVDRMITSLRLLLLKSMKDDCLCTIWMCTVLEKKLTNLGLKNI